jgi:hypothetical protein
MSTFANKIFSFFRSLSIVSFVCPLRYCIVIHLLTLRPAFYTLFILIFKLNLSSLGNKFRLDVVSETSSLNLCTISSLNWDLRGERGWDESQDSLGGEKSSVFQYCNYLLIF